MFLLRSAFWLTAAFLVIHPQADLGATAGALTSSAMAAGQKLIAEQISTAECTDLACLGARVAVTTLLTSSPSAEAPMQAEAIGPIPFPRPRPDWMG
jgi:hypothetical protein